LPAAAGNILLPDFFVAGFAVNFLYVIYEKEMRQIQGMVGV
jgi:hypothetical protein